MNELKEKYLNTRHGASPIGVVVIRDGAGNVIGETHNMVVLDGQRLLLQLLIGKLAATANKNGIAPPTKVGSYDGTAIDDSASVSMKLGFAYEQNPQTTEESMDYASCGEITKIDDTDIEYSLDATGVCATFKAVLTAQDSGGEINRFNEIFLTYAAGSESSYLFSRAIVDPVFLGAETSYSLEYTLYF